LIDVDDPAERSAAPRDDAERAALRALPEKYARMRTLRVRLGRGAPSPEHRDELRALAAAFPGALRELETLSTDTIAARLAAAEDAARRGEGPAWVLWTALYHVTLRAALAAKKSGDATPLPHGRLNVVVFAALAARFELDASTIWERLFPRTGRAPRPYR
jgi:hypothetical protein